MTTQSTIPGYTYGSPDNPPSPVSMDDLAKLEGALLFTEEDVQALRNAGDILVPQTDAILDVWYGFVGSHDFLLSYFADEEGPRADYLSRVRARFGKWIEDTCRATYDETWLSYQQEIAERHYTRKNQTDGGAAEGTPPIINWRYINALVYPIYATVRPFLEKGESDPEAVERMHQAWLKAVLLQSTLWALPYMREGAW